MQTRFKLIKLNAIDSTNDYLKDLSKKVDLGQAAVVVTHDQTNGRGQMDTKWHAEAGKSLCFSIFRRFSNFDVKHRFAINCAVSLGIKKGLDNLGVKGIAIKWPNDILAGGKKLCGILIENQLMGHQINSSVIGIGINVNNTHFPNLTKAVSLAIHSKLDFDLEVVLQELLEGIFSELEALDPKHLNALIKRYEDHLFRMNAISVFESVTGEKWNAIIRGVTSEGALKLEREDASLQQFNMKEIKLHY